MRIRYYSDRSERILSPSAQSQTHQSVLPSLNLLIPVYTATENPPDFLFDLGATAASDGHPRQRGEVTGTSSNDPGPKTGFISSSIGSPPVLDLPRHQDNSRESSEPSSAKSNSNNKNKSLSPNSKKQQKVQAYLYQHRQRLHELKRCVNTM